MTALEKAARAAWEENRRRAAMVDVELPAWEDDTMALRADWVAVTRAVLLAVREPDDSFMLHMYPNPTADVADGGRAAGERSRRAGRMQIARFVDSILNEAPTKTAKADDSSPPQ